MDTTNDSQLAWLDGFNRWIPLAPDVAALEIGSRRFSAPTSEYPYGYLTCQIVGCDQPWEVKVACGASYLFCSAHAEPGRLRARAGFSMAVVDHNTAARERRMGRPDAPNPSTAGGHHLYMLGYEHW